MKKPVKSAVSSMSPPEKRSRVSKPSILPGLSATCDSGVCVFLRFYWGFHLPVVSCFGRFLEKTSNGASALSRLNFGIGHF